MYRRSLANNRNLNGSPIWTLNMYNVQGQGHGPLALRPTLKGPGSGQIFGELARPS